MNVNSLFDFVLRNYSKEAQILKGAEECAELAAALLQFHNKGTEKEKKATIEELADVEIMLDQMKKIFDPLDIAAVKQQKLERLADRCGYRE